VTAQLGQRGKVLLHLLKYSITSYHNVTLTVLDMRGSNPLSRSMKKITVTMKEIYDAMKPSVEKNKKKYTRKTKHKNERLK
tara:strand:- start:250 stop:492 length:243 start_codon:yes stop_codon:yes gene_type:complete